MRVRQGPVVTPEFDRFVAIDWSAAGRRTTGSNSIWIAELVHDGEVQLSNVPTRREAGKVLEQIIERDERVLIGVDVCLGYPCGTAEVLGLTGDPWRSTWRTIAELSSDDARNANNRFEVAALLNRRAGGGAGPFWGCPNDDRAPDLLRTKPSASELSEFRLTEAQLRRRGHHPKSAWQLFGAGSVGGQTLTMLPILYRMLRVIDVWPFTTGLKMPSSSRVVVAEVWPSLFVTEIPDGVVPDAAQVAASVEALRAAAVSGALAAWFTPDVPDIDGVVSEEGWILGVV